MRRCFVLLFCLVTNLLLGQTINLKLQKELDSIYVLDQKYRELMYTDMNKYGDSLAAALGVSRENIQSKLWELQNKVDASNIIRVEAILKQYGYPGKTLVGEPANKAVFYVVQHSRVINQYLPLVKEAAEQNEIPFQLYAMMLDRSLMEQGKEQIYGTQGQIFEVKNPKTGNKEVMDIIWPIQDPDHVNERRKAAGFALTVEENAKRLDTVYKVYTLEEIKKLKGH